MKQEIALVIDESGAKGFSDNPESFPGEVGVMAGYLIPQSYVMDVRREIAEISATFQAEGKLHITDMDASAQGELRAAIFAYLSQVNAVWVYEAIYTEGLRTAISRQNETIKRFRAQGPTISQTSYRPEKVRLHAQLGYGVVVKAMAFCMDHVGLSFKLNVVSDRIDRSTVSEFEKSINRFLSIGSQRNIFSDIYDRETQTVVRRTCALQTTVIEGPWEDLTGIEYEIVIENSPLTLAADVLANSLNHHFVELQGRTPGADLHCPESIDGHPLCHLAYGVNGASWLTDAMYRHPNR